MLKAMEAGATPDAEADPALLIPSKLSILSRLCHQHAATQRAHCNAAHDTIVDFGKFPDYE